MEKLPLHLICCESVILPKLKQTTWQSCSYMVLTVKKKKKKSLALQCVDSRIYLSPLRTSELEVIISEYIKQILFFFLTLRPTLVIQTAFNLWEGMFSHAKPTSQSQALHHLSLPVPTSRCLAVKHQLQRAWKKVACLGLIPMKGEDSVFMCS